MNVVYVMPLHFDDDSSIIGGGDRYAYGLAKAMAKKAETVLITFSDKNVTRLDDEVTIRYYKTLFCVGNIANPFSLGFLKYLKDADVIHCLQFRTIVTELSILYGALMKKKVFVTDLAGGTIFTLSSLLPVWRGVQAFLLISEYNRKLQPNLPVKTHIISGGVDQNLFCPGNEPRKKGLLYVGRIFPLKGIHDLIEALPGEVSLDVVGTSHDDAYIGRLKAISAGKKVRFHHGMSDGELIQKYQESLAVVLPSLVDGGFTTAMESLACGTPVIGTKVGSLPEIVDDGVTGLLVPPGDVGALGAKINWLIEHPERAREMGMRGREKILEVFTWDRVVDRCLAAYRAD